MNPHWTDEHDSILKQSSRDEFSDLASMWNRSVNAVQKRFRKICPTNTKFSLWTEIEDDFLLANYTIYGGAMTARQIGLELNRSIGGVENRVGVLKRKMGKNKPEFKWKLNATYKLKERKPPIGVFIEFHGLDGDFMRLTHGQWRQLIDFRTDLFYGTDMLPDEASEYSLMALPPEKPKAITNKADLPEAVQ